MTTAEPVPDPSSRSSATSTGSSIVLLGDALVSLGWLQRVFSLERRASSVSLFGHGLRNAGFVAVSLFGHGLRNAGFVARALQSRRYVIRDLCIMYFGA